MAGADAVAFRLVVKLIEAAGIARGTVATQKNPCRAFGRDLVGCLLSFGCLIPRSYQTVMLKI